MHDKVIDSIIEITKNRDSDEFGLSIIATIAEIIFSGTVVLYKNLVVSEGRYIKLNSISTSYSTSGSKVYAFDSEVCSESINYINENYKELIKQTHYQTRDKNTHLFIPIFIEKEIQYAIDIASSDSFENKAESIQAIIKVCENFYAVLASCERDPLTGLYNRRSYDKKIGGLLRKQQMVQNKKSEANSGVEHRVSEKIAYTWLAVIDIDHFKNVNDKFGHIFGDEVLLTLSQLMMRSFRYNDLLFRVGGEEFVIIFEPITKQQAEKVLNKFRKIIEEYAFPLVGQISISSGFAKIMESDHPKIIFDNADRALYYAKEHGRNCVCNYEDLIEEGKIKVNQEEGDIELF